MTTPPSRIDPIIASFGGEIVRHSRIIDIGAGKGHLAQELERQLDARVTMVDVASYNYTRLPLTICDSRSLAFGNDSFDYALLSFVLHHSPHPERIVEEALRVARHVILVENDVRGAVRGLVTRVIDSWPAVRYGTPPCYRTRTRDEWLVWLSRFPVETRVLGEFTLERGFFRNFTVVLRRSGESGTA